MVAVRADQVQLRRIGECTLIDLSRGTRSQRRVLIGLLAVSAFSLSACGGSTLDPADVVRANQAVQGGGVPGSGPATGVPGPGTGVVDPSVPGGSVVDPGTPGSTAGPSTSGGTGTGGGPGTPGAVPAVGQGGKVASCAGFKNSTGITDDKITVANVADISGPVPGIFTPAQQAVAAYAAYFNSTSDICGRKLAVKNYDSQTNTSADAVATQKSCDETFASVGSMEAFDSGGAAIAARCGIPEIHAIITNGVRASSCDSCFATESPSGGYFQNAIPDYFTKVNKAATQKAAMLYVGVAASVDGAKAQIQGEKNRGWKFVYEASFDIAEFNYGPYVQKLKTSGARIVQLFGSPDMAVRMAKAFKAANYTPDYFVMNATSYDKAFEAAGSSVDGSIIYVDFTPIEEAAGNPELRLYLQWLGQVAPGARPTYFGMYAWSAARLFVEKAAGLGGRLTRANLVRELRTAKAWTSNGLHSPRNVGGKTVPECWRFLQIKGGKWSPLGPTKYSCTGRSRV